MGLKTPVWHRTTLLLALVLVTEVSVYDFSTENEVPFIMEKIDTDDIAPFYNTENNARFIRKIHSLTDAYRGDSGGRTVIETNALIDTRYRTWKRNVDWLNSLLGLPKGMNDAGR